MHAWHRCSHHSFRLPLRMNGMHRTQSDHTRFYLILFVTRSLVFWPSMIWNLHKHFDIQSKACTPQPLDITSNNAHLCPCSTTVSTSDVQLTTKQQWFWSSQATVSPFWHSSIPRNSKTLQSHYPANQKQPLPAAHQSTERDEEAATLHQSEETVKFYQSLITNPREIYVMYSSQRVQAH